MATPVFYTKSAPEDFKKNYSLAKDKHENYLRAKAATDFIIGIGITALGSVLTYFKDDLSKQDTIILNYVVAILPLIGAALEKLYETRSNRYAQFIGHGKNLGYKKNYLYPPNPDTSYSESSQENTDDTPTYSSSTSGSESEQTEVTISTYYSEQQSIKDKVYDSLKEVFNEKKCCSREIKGWKDIEDIFDDNAEDILQKKLGVKVDVTKAFKKLRDSEKYKKYTDNKIVDHIADNIAGLYKDIKSFEKAQLAESITKTFVSVSVFSLGIAASIFNHLIDIGKSKSGYNDIVSGINIAIAVVPVAAAAFLFARTVWYKTFLCCDKPKVAKCSGIPVDNIKTTFKKFKREAFDSKLIEKLPINIQEFVV